MNSITPLVQFPLQHFICSLGSCVHDLPHITPLFYAFDPYQMILVFISDPMTRHMREISLNPRVSATVYAETEIIEKIQGVQLWGRALFSSEKEILDLYLTRFPHSKDFIREHPSHLSCTVKIQKARLIDNTVGFGEKQEWSFDV